MKQIPALLFLLFPVQAAEPDIEMLKDTLVANADSFDRLEIQADGSTTDFAVSLGTEAVELDGNTYDGFRFKCPEEIAGKDFVWYFNAPEHWGNWYIFAVEGKPGQAFRNWIDADKIYSPFDKSPEKKRLRILQTFGGGYFKPGGEYLMWFRKMGDGADTSLRGTAAFAGEREKWDHEDVEKALKLRPAPAEEQVTALGSRGGLILLDTRFFKRNDAERRIESAFTSIRSTKQSSDGFFVTMQIAVPPCTTSPLLADIVREHGEPDFVRTSAEMQQVRQHAGGSPGDEDEAITSYHYDYFAFETKTGAKNPKITRVRTFGCDFSDVAPPAKGSGYSSIGIENLTIFHRDGKEVGRAYYFLEGNKKPLFITRPPEGEYKSDNQTLTMEDAGKWTWQTRHAGGKIARTISLEQDQLHGSAEGFYPDGKPSFKASYKNGVLDGEVVQFDEDGTEVSRRRFKEGEPVDE